MHAHTTRRGATFAAAALLATAVAWAGAATPASARTSSQASATPSAAKAPTPIAAAKVPTDQHPSALSYGYVRVVTSPAVPAEIRLDNTPRDSWGLNWLKYTAGDGHPVCFGEVLGYTAPACQQIDIHAGATTTVTGNYVQNGYLRVITSPAVPSTISVDGTPRNDWGLWTEIATGNHTVCFGAVQGSNVPACRTVNVVAGATATTTGTFTSNPDAAGPTGTYGYLRVTTAPAVGGMISVDGLARNNWGIDWVKIATGSHTVCFQDVYAFVTPGCKTVNVTSGATTTTTGNYEAMGYIRVVTSPPVPSTVYVYGIASNDYGVWTPKAVGTYNNVCFGRVGGRATPACQNGVVVTAGATTTVTGTFAVDTTDTDGDRLVDSVESNDGTYLGPNDTGTNPNVADSDGDGIKDGDEVLGTAAGLNLPALGFQPNHKDIAFEFDWFNDNLDPGTCASHSHRPTSAILTRLSNAFAAGPVTNPDGVNGVHVIGDYGQGGAFTGGNLVADADGVIAGGVNGTDYNAIKAANFDTKRQGIFHYVEMPHRYNTNSNSSGQAEIAGNDMIVSIYCYTDTVSVANTIMHEVGHNLGLRHGGDADLPNYKPNYNSIMNYQYQFPGIDSNCVLGGDGILDYSRGTRLPLAETALFEPNGMCNSVGIDWNGNGTFDSAAVAADINGDGVQTTLTDFNDWANISLANVALAGTSPLGDFPEVVTEQPVPGN